MSLIAPVRVAVIDIAASLADLHCERAEPPPRTAAWIHAREAGQTLGSTGATRW
jgi:hypothetical protein